MSQHTISIPPLVNDQGNINVHINEGCQIPISDRGTDGNEINISTAPMYFIAGGFRKALDLDPNNALGRMLVLTPANLTAIVHGSPFVIADETNPAMPINRWEGRIFKRG